MGIPESGSPAWLNLKAPAKINLFLKVIGRRPDGRHDLSSIMLKLGLADEIGLSRSAAGISLECLGLEVPADESNLAWRAARLFIDETGLSSGVKIRLNKQIPLAAGLGGGSSDGAAVLTGMNRLFKLGLSEDTLAEMAVRLGADLPFFVRSFDCAYAEGIGERLTPVAGPRGCRVVLVNPGFPVSTRWVFDNFALTSRDNPYILAPERDSPDMFSRKSAAGGLFSNTGYVWANDLERVTVVRYPELGKVKKALTDGGADLALMSGSGPTVFGIFSDGERAVSCYEEFRQQYGENVFLTHPGYS